MRSCGAILATCVLWVRRGESRLIQENVEAALQDWEKAIAIDVEQTERFLGLREAGFGDSALEQLPDATRETIQKLAGDLQDRNSPAAALGSLRSLAEQSGNFFQAASEATLAASTARKEVASRSCTEADVNLALQRGQFSEVAPCLGKVLTLRTSAELRIRVASALLEAGEYETALKTLEGMPAADRNSG